MINIKYTNIEEIVQMNKHKWIESEKQDHDIGDSAYFEWVRLYAEPFRVWSKTIPENCIKCGLDNCSKDTSECSHPFHDHRIRFFMAIKNYGSI